MNAHKIAENLCKRAEAQGLCHPTEGMLAECIDNILSDQLFEVDYELREGGHVKAADYLDVRRRIQEMERQQESED